MATSSGLGKALLNRKAKEAVAPKESQLYSLDDSNPLASVTHERDLDEFLANAALADADFTTERSKIRVVSAGGMPSAQANPFLLTPAEERKIARKQAEMRGGLTVPRRPAWTRSTTRQELDRQERESFLEWRRSLAYLAEDSNLLLTPFERNIQLWRQLWRVLERSHLVVQIVDARNPLGFRSVDLERYVGEVGDSGENGDVTVPGKGKRRSLLLVNKADLLTYEQRSAWAEYFEQEGVRYAFFSAADAAALQEQAEKQRRREMGDEYPVGEDDDEDEEAGDGESDIDEEEEEDVSGEEVEPQSPVAGMSEALNDATIDDDDEEGWSTEGEQEDAESDAAGERLQSGQRVPLAHVAQAVAADAPVEDIRTRVLTVTELEDLFESAAPPLSDFATERDPHPSKLMIGLVGYPNVGKSSTINALIGSKKVSVSATPGKTKHFQTLVLSDRITLCDCPGLVFPQFANTQADMVCDGVLPIDQMREYSAPVDLVCRRVPRDIIEGTYGIRIDVKEVEDGGSGKVGWEELLSAYAIARGMTRSSFGMPDTSRAARYVLKDYVNARLLYGHPPPGLDADEYMSTSREATLASLEAAFEAGRKRAPTHHVSKNADTYVAPAPDVGIGAVAAAAGDGPDAAGEGVASTAAAKRERQSTSRQVKSTAASAPARSGREKASALDGVFFTDAGPAPRPVIMGRRQGPADPIEESGAYSRSTMYPHQRRLGPDGMPMVGGADGKPMRDTSKRHFKGREGKKRSGRGYD